MPLHEVAPGAAVMVRPHGSGIRALVDGVVVDVLHGRLRLNAAAAAEAGALGTMSLLAQTLGVPVPHGPEERLRPAASAATSDDPAPAVIGPLECADDPPTADEEPDEPSVW